MEAGFISRDNRFAATVEVDGRRERVHVPNSGRMRELLLPGAWVLLHPASKAGRRTAFDLVAVDASGTLVSVDSRVPNAVVAEALAARSLPGINGYDRVRPESTRGRSRFDFLLEGRDHDALVEVKGCTLVEGEGRALFPDAPTTRGARHVRELARAVDEGIDAHVVVVVQRDDGRTFSPNDRTDPDFGDALRRAAAAGVQVHAFLTDVTREGVQLSEAIPVDLSPAFQGVAP